MSSKVLSTVQRLNRVIIPNQQLLKVEDLLKRCKKLAFLLNANGGNDIWYDLRKKAKPKGQKKGEYYELKKALALVADEMLFLVDVWVVIRKFAQTIRDKRPKSLLLSVLRYLFKRSFSTGGGTPFATHRVLAIYESEVEALKQANPTYTEQEEEEEEDFADEDIDLLGFEEDLFSEAESEGQDEPPPKKVKYVQHAALAVVTEPEPALFVSPPTFTFITDLPSGMRVEHPVIHRADIQEALDMIEKETLNGA